MAADGGALESSNTADGPSLGVDVCSVVQEVSNELHVENHVVARCLKRGPPVAVARGSVDVCTPRVELLDEAKVTAARSCLHRRLAVASNSLVVDSNTRFQYHVHNIAFPAIVNEPGQQRVVLAISVHPRRVHLRPSSYQKVPNPRTFFSPALCTCFQECQAHSRLVNWTPKSTKSLRVSRFPHSAATEAACIIAEMPSLAPFCAKILTASKFP